MYYAAGEYGGLYHTKNYQGTITKPKKDKKVFKLYHTKNYQGE